MGAIMATTTAKAFEEFNDVISLTPDQRMQVTKRTAAAAEYLRKFLPPDSSTPVLWTRLMGSAARQTIIRPLDDIDVIAKFENKNDVFEKYRHASNEFLYHIRNTLEAKTQIQKVGTRGQAIRLFYTNGPHVDIACVFGWASGGYVIPAGDGTWQQTDPFAQAAWIDERQKALNNYLKKRVRFLKRWNRVHSGRLQSFHLEIMVANVFGSMNSDSRDCLEKFFIWAPNNLGVSDPAGFGGDLSSYLTWNDRSAVLQNFDSARERAARANAAEAASNHAEAIRLWRIVLGDEFPAYG
jgi:hypothetical protein